MNFPLMFRSLILLCQVLLTGMTLYCGLFRPQSPAGPVAMALAGSFNLMTLAYITKVTFSVAEKKKGR